MTHAIRRLLPAAVALAGFALFAGTLAPGMVFGDPTEYTLVPHLWGILHPPGYAFMTLLVKLWQTLIPIGTLAYRTNLLSAAAGAAAGALVFGMVNLTLPPLPSIQDGRGERAGVGGEALLAALSLYAAADFWQHSIHTNAHIVTAMLASLALFVLLRWQSTGNDRWLIAFAFVAGLSVTHHPLLAFGFPAYAAFILAEWASRLRAKAIKLTQLLPVAANMAASGGLGLFPWLYFPIRSAVQPPPPFGPHDMNTLDGFLNLALARGLTNVNLFHFSLGEQWQRLIVFWSLIQLQYSWPVLALAVLGLVWLAKRNSRAALLLGLHAFVNLAFTLNTVQDVMAYLLVPLVSLAVCIGAGALAVGELVGKAKPSARPVALAALLLFPLANIAWLAPRISLRHLRAADDYADSVFAHFNGKGEHAVLLSDWEHATPLWYRQIVDGQTLNPADLTVVYVNKPFVDAVWENIDKGPLYLIEYNPDIVATGFRLRAEGRFYRLVPPPATEAPPIAHPLHFTVGPLEWLGYDVLTRTTRPGGVVPIILYLRAPAATDRLIHPYAALGAWEQRFSTDSHLLSPYWQAGEVIAERWDVTVPLTAQAGGYPLSVGFSDLVSGEALGRPESLGVVTVEGNGEPPGTKLAANFGQRVGVEWARAWTPRGAPTAAPWADPVSLRAGQSIELRIKWRALASPENSYTVFIHLLDADNALVASRDYTPLGGAFPTMLWFPKWLPGQTVVDPYTLTVPTDAPPGDYLIEMGLYGLRSVVRVPAFDAEGNLAGDRFVLGSVRVTP